MILETEVGLPGRWGRGNEGFSRVLPWILGGSVAVAALALGPAVVALPGQDQGQGSEQEQGQEPEQDRVAKRALRIEIHKADRRLRVYAGSRLEADYPVGLGFAPNGHKLREGDGATPEGSYRVCVKNPQSRFYLSLGLDYPNPEDARRARERGHVSAEEERAIVEAHRQGRCPPWNTALGGEIYIHGRGASEDWTLGCVALDDPAMKSLFASIPVGTEVSVLP